MDRVVQLAIGLTVTVSFPALFRAFSSSNAPIAWTGKEEARRVIAEVGVVMERRSSSLTAMRPMPGQT